MTGPTLELELGYGGPVVGVDEAGRGPLAGPVGAAAVLLDPDCIPDGINDSKKLHQNSRARLHDQLVRCARVGAGIESDAGSESHHTFQAGVLAEPLRARTVGTAPVAGR